MASATQDDPLSTLLKKWIPYLALPESTWLSLVAHNMVRKSGIVMATPRSIVDLVTVRLESLEAGVDCESLEGGRCWPKPVHRKSRFVRARGRYERSHRGEMSARRRINRKLRGRHNLWTTKSKRGASTHG